jgi:hypothetical protein
MWKFEAVDGSDVQLKASPLIHHHHHHLAPWIRSLDLFRHRRFAIVSWGVHELFFV